MEFNYRSKILWFAVVILLLILIYYAWDPFGPRVYGEGLRVIPP